jgi:DNA invertase Pin-like site-specific DNA recombinase
MKIGYARVSTDDQNLDLQHDELKRAGCENIYSEHISSTKAERPQLQACLKALRHDDVLVIWRLDRLGRNLKELIELVNELEKKGCGLVSLKESIDTTTPTGRLVFHIFASLAQFERELIQERTKAGIQSARERGKVGGRPSKLTLADKTMIQALMSHQETNIKELALRFGVSRATLYRVCDEMENKEAQKGSK